MPRSKEAFESMRETTRQKIEAAALPLFARKGLSVTVGEITVAAGLSKGLLYNHYPSKEALILELMRRAAHISAQTIKAVFEKDTFAAEKIKQITAMMCQMITAVDSEGIEYFMFMVQAGMSGMFLQEDVYNAENPNPNETFARIISAGQSEGSVVGGEPMQLATVYWAAVQGLCGYAMTGMKLSVSPQLLNRILLKENFI